MTTLLNFLILAGVTCLAAAAAGAIEWMVLRYAMHLMEPAAARQVVVRPRPESARGTLQVVRAYAPRAK